jgi:hypothetical protein
VHPRHLGRDEIGRLLHRPRVIQDKRVLGLGLDSLCKGNENLTHRIRGEALAQGGNTLKIAFASRPEVIDAVRRDGLGPVNKRSPGAMRKTRGIVWLVLELYTGHVRPGQGKRLGQRRRRKEGVDTIGGDACLQLCGHHGYSGGEECGGERRGRESRDDKVRVGAHAPFCTTHDELESGFVISGKSGRACNPQLVRDMLLTQTSECMGENDIGCTLIVLQSRPHGLGQRPGRSIGGKVDAEGRSTGRLVLGDARHGIKGEWKLKTKTKRERRLKSEEKAGDWKRRKAEAFIAKFEAQNVPRGGTKARLSSGVGNHGGRLALVA